RRPSRSRRNTLAGARGKPEVLVESKSAEDWAMSDDGRICVKTIKRGECIELGHDKFDDVLNEFLAKFNRDQIISIQSVNYAHFYPSTRKYLDNYGAMIVYQR
ncbi:MAG: hypothetical protein VYE14_01445, partial [Verrucomicrobiota bacterium]|nr:hypothetical protein [Verrucomicrobiota bacterium]